MAPGIFETAGFDQRLTLFFDLFFSSFAGSSLPQGFENPFSIQHKCLPQLLHQLFQRPLRPPLLNLATKQL
jgi:superfamily II DNA/RNA helicase